MSLLHINSTHMELHQIVKLFPSNYFTKMVTGMGFEPMYATVKGWCVKPLHQPAKWCHPRDSNPQPIDYKSIALPIVLGWQNGAPGRTRTYDLTVNSRLLYQLSYWSNNGCPGWIRTTEMQESKSCALPLGYRAINGGLKWN